MRMSHLPTNWLARIHVKDKYTVDDPEVAEGEGRLVLRVLCIHYIGT